jgi:hypothetical protein
LQSGTIKQITDAFRTYGHENLILVDWSAYNIGNYIGAINNSVQIGNLIGIKLYNVFGKDLRYFELIGHSLGAHLSGNINRGIASVSNNKARIPIITGLDPAGPGFYNASNNNSPVRNPLNASDADMVYISHTDTLHYGAPVKVGSVDFWPNGGNNQTGCPPFNSSVVGLSPASGFFSEIFFNHTNFKSFLMHIFRLVLPPAFRHLLC